jgi:ABC transporter DrrB family efflux protein
MADTAIEIEDLHVVRGGRCVIDGLDLHVAAGSVTGLLGPSGCGKSTLMRAIVGVQIIQSGQVMVLGEPGGSPQLRRRVGYVTQAPSVYGDLSISENLRYFAAVVGVGQERVGEVIHTVGLAGREQQIVGSLSGGERSRVSLASALLNDPELLVLDEPTVGLDPVLRAELWRTFQAIGAPMCGLFPFIIMFLVTSIAMLRERTSGTLERLMSLPIAKVDLLVGYGVAFGLLAALQAVVVCLVGFLALGLHAPHGVWLVGLLAVGNAVLGMALGLFVSAFARTEFQAVQFMPAIIFPQLLLCGLFVDRHEMASALYGVSWVLPLTYAYDALARATRSGALGGRMAIDICVILSATLVALTLGALTLRRRTA